MGEVEIDADIGDLSYTVMLDALADIIRVYRLAITAAMDSGNAQQIVVLALATKTAEALDWLLKAYADAPAGWQTEPTEEMIPILLRPLLAKLDELGIDPSVIPEDEEGE